ncbi:hypothetical protein NEOLI_001045, partial [Neolecta irregularis DAH-3]
PLSVSRAFRFPYAPRRSSASPLTERSISLSLDPAPRRHSVAFTPSHTPEIKHKVPYRGPSPASQPASPSTADPADHVRSDLKIAAAQVDRYFSSDDHRTRAREIVALCPPGSVPGRTTPTAPGAAYKSLHIVEFKACRTDVFFVPEESQLVLRTGDLVIVEADRGRDLGKIVRDNVTMVQVRALKAQQQRDQLAAMNQEFTAAPSDPLVNPKVIHRMAQPNEVNMLISKSQDENHAMSVCQGKVLQRLMPMEVLDAEYQWFVDTRQYTHTQGSPKIDILLLRIAKNRFSRAGPRPVQSVQDPNLDVRSQSRDHVKPKPVHRTPWGHWTAPSDSPGTDVCSARVSPCDMGTPCWRAAAPHVRDVLCQLLVATARSGRLVTPLRTMIAAYNAWIQFKNGVNLEEFPAWGRLELL